ncbi:MAG: vWA domain-containing protein, partial [Planctomycetota bacterium]
DPAPRLAGASAGERSALDAVLASGHWPIRVFGLLRLERYAPDGLEPIVRRHLADEAWQVRCFALRAAQRLGLAVTVADLPPDEREPLVIRAALRAGVTLDEDLVRRTAARLLRTKQADSLMLGIEIAAAGDDEALRRDAARRCARLIRGMDGAVERMLGGRITVVLGLPRRPRTAAEWRAALDDTGRSVAFAPRDRQRLDAGLGAPRIADLDAESFAKLVDYVDVLKQRDLEVAIVMDATASMLPMLTEARAGVDSLILFLNDVSRAMRVALVAYRDHDNTMPLWEGQVFTRDITEVRRFLFALRIGGGADLPEAVLEGIAACDRLEWSPPATRQIILVGDARPHERDLYQLRGLVESFRNRGTVLHAVHIPMAITPERAAMSTPMQVEAIDEHNRHTAADFADLAEAGGGRMVTLADARDLVPSIMHMTLHEAWWPVFDEFYALYMRLCR